MLPYLLTFCRITIGLTFAYSFLMKVRDVNQFAQTIANFKLVPLRWERPLALLFLAGELTVVGLALASWRFLASALGLAMALLAAFTIALISALMRNIHTKCNCFGTSDKPITRVDVCRNIGLILVAVVGLWATRMADTISAYLTFIETLFLAIMACVFVLVWANLNDIAALYRMS